MCVIFVANDVRPTEDMVTKAFHHNNSGAGIAWREDGLVKWRKGLSLEEIVHLVSVAPLPFISHYRIPTCGGSSEEMCHPFPIDLNTNLMTEGETDGYVLFHNGHWKDWKEATLKTALHKGMLPTGKWSDSRAMAWNASIYGIGILEFIDEKAIAFGPSDLEVFGTGWTKVNDVFVSNKHWEYTTRGGRNQCYPNNVVPNSVLGNDKGNDKGDGKKEEVKEEKKETIIVNSSPSNKIVIRDGKIEEEPGGALRPLTFRGSEQTLVSRDVEQKSMEESTKALPIVNDEDIDTFRHILTGEITEGRDLDLQAFEWARNINQKPLRGGGVDTREAILERQRRIDAARKGITRLM